MITLKRKFILVCCGFMVMELIPRITKMLGDTIANENYITKVITGKLKNDSHLNRYESPDIENPPVLRHNLTESKTKLSQIEHKYAENAGFDHRHSNNNQNKEANQILSHHNMLIDPKRCQVQDSSELDVAGSEYEEWLFGSIPNFNSLLYPLKGDIRPIVDDVLEKRKSLVAPINMFKYAVFTENSVTCIDTSPALLIMVKSSIYASQRRNAIRLTWGNETYFRKYNIKTVFLVGTDGDNTLSKTVMAENAIHHDVVHGNFIDHYYNNTLRTVMGLQWYACVCSNATFGLIVDDDYMITTDRLVIFLQTLDKDELANSYYGFVINDVPHRELKSKWYVSESDYPFRTYPKFVTGGAIVLTVDVARRFTAAIKFTRHFIFDDVFLGIVAEKAGIKTVNLQEFSPYVAPYRETFQTNLAFHHTFSIHSLLFAWRQYCTITGLDRPM